jgi:hypothetical protein
MFDALPRPPDGGVWGQELDRFDDLPHSDEQEEAFDAHAKRLIAAGDHFLEVSRGIVGSRLR